MQDSTVDGLPEAVWQQLSRWGFLLLQDGALPSVASIIAGGPVAGSWWAHPAAHETYDACQALEAREDVLQAKLVAGKVTFVLNRLWPALLSVAQAREVWQVDGLTSEALALLALADEAGTLRLDQLPDDGKALRDSARELERRLLVFGDQVHTDSGAHTKVIVSWSAWLHKNGRGVTEMPVGAAKLSLERAVGSANEHFGANSLLPWQPKRRKR